jgi:F-type H+/Na+-transporting ATPase subunit alpha
MLDEIRSKGTDILDSIRKDKVLSDDTKKKLVAFLNDFAKVFVA